MLVYRIVHKMFSNSLFASGIRGRWNSAGNKVIYTAESIPVAFLENMVRRQGVGFNDDFNIMFVESRMKPRSTPFQPMTLILHGEILSTMLFVSSTVISGLKEENL